MKRVLITGMSGLIGGVLRRHLEELGDYELSALNRRPVEGGVKCTQADIANLDAIRPAFEGIDVVAHLAANLDLDSWKSQLSGNVIGTYNVYEASRLAGVKRVVFASSGATIRGFEFIPPYDAIAAGRYDEVPKHFPLITHEMVWPNDIYGSSKIWGESLGRHFSVNYDLSILCVRIGVVPKDNRPKEPRDFASYLSHRDVAQMFRRCIDAPDHLLYDVFMATSANKWGYRDLEHPRNILGYQPQDTADTFRQ